MSLIVTIPANGNVQTVLTGSYTYFFFRTAESPVQVSYDNGNTWNVRYQNDQDKPISARDRVLIRSLKGVAVELEVDWGHSQFTAQQSTISGAVSSEFTNNIVTNAAVVPLQFAKTGNAGAPVALSAALLYFRWVVLIAQRDLLGTANTGNVKIGFQAGANLQPITLSPGDQYVLPIPVGAKVDFQNVYLAIANAGDGIVALYV